jgi:hypothetical protein
VKITRAKEDEKKQGGKTERKKRGRRTRGKFLCAVLFQKGSRIGIVEILGTKQGALLDVFVSAWLRSEIALKTRERKQAIHDNCRQSRVE